MDWPRAAAMLRTGVPLAPGLAAARLFFGGAFQPAASLRALTFFKDGDLPRLGPADQRVLIQGAAAVGDLPRPALRSRALAIRL